MTDNTDLIAEAQAEAAHLRTSDARRQASLLTRLADALAARDAACGHLPNELVAKALAVARRGGTWDAFLDPHLTDDEVVALRAATFEVTE